MGKAYRLNWEQINKEALRHFKGLLKIDTTNPPGNELEAVRFLNTILKKEGFKTDIIKTGRNRGCIAARLSGKNNSKPPIILTSHVDVVPHNPESWELPAFAAMEKNGCLYGRGTLDMKNMTIMSLMTLILLKRLNIETEREIIFTAVADEESGSRYGMEYLVENKPGLFRGAEYALNEVGGFTMHVGESRIYTIQTAEKGVLWLKLIIEGTPGHGSLPHGENPVVHLSRVLNGLYNRKNRVRLTPAATAFINTLSGCLAFPESFLFKHVKSPLAGNFIINRLLPEGGQKAYLNAILHDTISPNVILSGKKENVIPGSSEAVLDCRLLPGTDLDRFTEDLRADVKRLTPLDFSLETIDRGEPSSWSHDTDLFRLIKRKIEEADPGSTAVPGLTSGVTDSKFLDRLGITCYGFTPVRIPEGMRFSQLIHGHNERIPVDGFFWGLKLFFETVREFTEV